MVERSVEDVSKQSTSGMAIASLVCGILGLVFVGALRIFALIPAMLALVLGVMARLEIKKDNLKKGTGLTTAGIVLGIFICVGLFGVFMALMDA